MPCSCPAEYSPVDARLSIARTRVGVTKTFCSAAVSCFTGPYRNNDVMNGILRAPNSLGNFSFGLVLR